MSSSWPSSRATEINLQSRYALGSLPSEIARASSSDGGNGGLAVTRLASDTTVASKRAHFIRYLLRNLPNRPRRTALVISFSEVGRRTTPCPVRRRGGTGKLQSSIRPAPET